MEKLLQRSDTETGRRGEGVFLFLLSVLFASFLFAWTAGAFQVPPGAVSSVPVPEQLRRAPRHLPAALTEQDPSPLRILRSSRSGSSAAVRILTRGTGNTASGECISAEALLFVFRAGEMGLTGSPVEGSFWLVFSVSALPVRAGPEVC